MINDEINVYISSLESFTIYIFLYQSSALGRNLYYEKQEHLDDKKLVIQAKSESAWSCLTLIKFLFFKIPLLQLLLRDIDNQ